MVTTSAVSPFIATYATTTPYITVGEFNAAPTALSTSDLIPGGSVAQNTQALVDSIARASGWVDFICDQVLAATTDVELETYRIDRNGMLRVPLKYKPVLATTGISIGARPSSMVAIPDFSDVVVKRNSVEIPVTAWTFPITSGLLGPWNIGDRVLVQTTYINGWVNALISNNPAAGASSVQVNNALGIYPGTQLRISDTVNSEAVVVAPSYVAGATTIPLVAPLAFAHTVGVSISNLPLAVKEATILLTCVVIQTRGNDAIILDALETPARTQGMGGAQANDIDLAKNMLLNVMRRW